MYMPRSKYRTCEESLECVAHELNSIVMHNAQWKFEAGDDMVFDELNHISGLDFSERNSLPPFREVICDSQYGSISAR